jgi:hypothetical protein
VPKMEAYKPYCSYWFSIPREAKKGLRMKYPALSIS